MLSLSEDQARLLRVRAQRLDPWQPDLANNVAQAVAGVCGVQAQVAAAAALAVRVRSTGLTASDVEQARVNDRSVVRTWCMRGTLHLLATEDLGWLLPLFGPVFIRASRRRFEELGLDEETSTKGISALRQALARRGPLTRAEIVDELGARGIRLAGQARPYLIRHAALQGVVCFGPSRGGEPTYVLLDDWTRLGSGLAGDAACTELASRYLEAYGPAGPDDMAAWSGLPMSAVRAGWRRIAGQLIELEVSGRPAWMLRARAASLADGPGPRSAVRLVPGFDTYLLGYRSRRLAIADRYAGRVNAGGGMIRPALLVDGRVQGTWKGRPGRKELGVVVEPFEALAPMVITGIEADARDLGRFCSTEAKLSLMLPP